MVLLWASTLSLNPLSFVWNNIHPCFEHFAFFFLFDASDRLQDFVSQSHFQNSESLISERGRTKTGLFLLASHVFAGTHCVFVILRAAVNFLITIFLASNWPLAVLVAVYGPGLCSLGGCWDRLGCLLTWLWLWCSSRCRSPAAFPLGLLPRVW